MVVYIFPQARVLRHWHERIKPYRPLHPIRSVLIVCKANICRSPLAEAYFRSQLQAQEKSIAVCSAGLEAAAGKPASQTAIMLAREYHLDLRHACDENNFRRSRKGIRPHSRNGNFSTRSDYACVSGGRRQVVLLGYFDTQGPLEIADPYGRSLEEFSVCFCADPSKVAMPYRRPYRRLRRQHKGRLHSGA